MFFSPLLPTYFDTAEVFHWLRVNSFVPLISKFCLGHILERFWVGCLELEPLNLPVKVLLGECYFKKISRVLSWFEMWQLNIPIFERSNTKLEMYGSRSQISCFNHTKIIIQYLSEYMKVPIPFKFWTR